MAFSFVLFFTAHCAHRDLLSFPTRRSSDLKRSAEHHPARRERRRPPAPARPERAPQSPRDGFLQHRVVLGAQLVADRKSTRLNSSHTVISYAVFCLKKKKKNSQFGLQSCDI